METIKKRIEDVLELELERLLTESGAKTGDITPLQWVELNRITTEAAALFTTLIEQNK